MRFKRRNSIGEQMKHIPFKPHYGSTWREHQTVPDLPSNHKLSYLWASFKLKIGHTSTKDLNEIAVTNHYLRSPLNGAQQIEQAKKLGNSADAAAFLRQLHLHDQAVGIAVKKIDNSKDIEMLLSDSELPSYTRLTLSMRIKELPSVLSYESFP